MAFLNKDVPYARYAFDCASRNQLHDSISVFFSAWASFELGEVDKALILWREIGAANYFYFRARDLYGDNDSSSDEVLTLLQTSILIEPNADAYLLLGDVFDSLESGNQAINAYEKALVLSPNSSDAWAKLGSAMFWYRGQDEIALEYLGHALHLDPANINARISLGDKLLRLGRYDEAAEQFEAVLNLSPDHANAHWQMGRYYSLKGDKPRSLQEFQLAVALQPVSQDYMISLGDAYLHIDNCAFAQQTYRQACLLGACNEYIAQRLEQTQSCLK